jgi:hypothetical protein
MNPPAIPATKPKVNFWPIEFACPCKVCSKLPPPEVRPDLIARLEELRHALGDVPIAISSGYRCPSHNADPKIGGAVGSRHLRLPVEAADIEVPGYDALTLWRIASGLHIFAGMGLGPKWAGQLPYLHVDLRETPARWGYDEHGAQVGITVALAQATKEADYGSHAA